MALCHSIPEAGTPADKIDAWVERLLRTAPPLTPEQRDRIAAIVRTSAGGAPPGARPAPATGGTTSAEIVVGAR